MAKALFLELLAVQNLTQFKGNNDSHPWQTHWQPSVEMTFHLPWGCSGQHGAPPRSGLTHIETSVSLQTKETAW